METTKKRVQSNPVASITETINVPIGEAFDYIQPVPLPILFPGFQSIPAVVSSDEKELWVSPGKSRTVTFADGNTAYESMLHVDFPNYFSYKLENFTSELGNLVEKVEGAWVFTELEAGKVLIYWKYVFIPRSEEAKAIIEAHVIPGFQGVLKQAIAISKKNLEAGNI